jgi:transposase-like protein
MPAKDLKPLGSLAAAQRPLELFACPNPDCDLFNRFAAGNLSICEWTGKRKHIRRLYCHHCGHRFSERQGTLWRYSKLPEPAVVRILKCLGHGCSIEAAADICDVDPRTVERLLQTAGRRAESFHQLQLDRLEQPPEAVQLDELHARVQPPRPAAGDTGGAGAKKGGARPAAGLLGRVAAWVVSGFMRPWRSSAAS